MRKKHYSRVLLAKAMIKAIEVLISKALTESNINHDEFASVNHMLREYNEIKVEVKNIENAVKHII